ncbi:MAG: hypothetical protein GC171_11850 [Terrimonas sp.]|nr:hypothetical protein [Terrimonas sp.]
MKIIYTILFLFTAFGLILLLFYFFNSIDNHSGLLQLSGIALGIVMLIVLLFLTLTRYLRVPPKQPVK